jgi:hypothetical protein
VIVHYELPWNPSRMLQRAGRVDRIGQRHRVHEIALVACDTAESLVLAPLARRTSRWSGGAGGRMIQLLTESRVAALIFDGVTADVVDPPAEPDRQLTVDLSEDAVREASRHERREVLRGALSRPSHRRRGRIAVSTLARSSWPPGLVLVFDITIAAPDRSVIERSPIALHVDLALPFWPERPRDIKTLIEQLLPGLRAATAPHLETARQRQHARTRDRYQDAAARFQRRSTALRRNQESVARQLVQAGLFERRAKCETRPGRDELEFVGATEEAAPSELGSATDLRAVLIVRPR